MNISKSLSKIVLSLLCIAYFLGVNAQSTVPTKSLKSITPEKVKTYINYLASDALLGRGTPSPGQDSAAAYITREFIKCGLQPVNGSYLNLVPLITRTLGDENYVEITKQGETKSLTIKTEFTPFEISTNSGAEGTLVFAGYGITDTEHGYDDYSGINAAGKIAVIMKHSPGESNASSFFKEKKYNQYNTLNYKVVNAIKHGAIGILIVTDPANHLLLAPKGYPWPKLNKNVPLDAIPIILNDTIEKLPIVHVGEEVINILFGDLDSLKRIENKIDKTLKPISREFPEIRVKMKTSVIETPVKTGNIVGFLPGSDPTLKNEILVIGAHYDHVGFMKKHKPDERYIFNGADDNASGSTGLLCIAEAFSKAKIKTKRSILFIAFTAEELGLYGSESYVRKPLFPLSQTVAMLNMDMIGRGHPDTLYLDAGKLSPDITELIKKENEGFSFKIQVEGDEFLDRSDQSGFYHKNIPFAMFNTGEHPDYHTVRDRPELIKYEKLSRIAQLVFKTAWDIANDNKRYKVIEK